MDSRSFYGAKKYTVRLPPEYESEDSELSDSGDEDPDYMPPKKKQALLHSESSDSDDDVALEDTDELEKVSESGDPGHFLDISATTVEENATSNEGNCSTTTPQSRRPIWKSLNPNDTTTQVELPLWKGTLPSAIEVKSPLGYFQQFFEEELLDFIVEQSNLYAVQNNPNRPLCLSRHELEQFLGCCMLMSIFKLPRSRMYWASNTRISQIADIMTRDRWEAIKRNLHLNNNENIPSIDAAANHDRLFKIRPLLDSLLPKYQQLSQQQVLCIDEQIVPFKGRSSMKQYLPNKPHKWGYKLFVLCDTSGIVHNFEIYTGKILPVEGYPDLGATANIVFKLSQVIESNLNHVLCFDNWYTSINLLAELTLRSIFAIGTIRSNRLLGCTLLKDKELKKKGRGSFEEKSAVIDGEEVRIVKWFDNRAVTLASTCASALPLTNIDRYDRSSKQIVAIQCPSIVKSYNKYMGGVDLLDALISYYRIHLKSKKYYHRLFFHFIDMTVVTGWLLYRRDCNSFQIPQSRQHDLLEFKILLAESLCKTGKDVLPKKKGRPSTQTRNSIDTPLRRAPPARRPQDDVRSDKIGHWPEVADTRQRCKRLDCTGRTNILCSKCKVHLCLNKNNNCFKTYHL